MVSSIFSWICKLTSEMLMYHTDRGYVRQNCSETYKYWALKCFTYIVVATFSDRLGSHLTTQTSGGSVGVGRIQHLAAPAVTFLANSFDD